MSNEGPEKPANLVLTLEDDDGHGYWVSEHGQAVSFGRSTRATNKLDRSFRGIDGFHCLIRFAGLGQFEIANMTEHRNTFVNGVRLAPGTRHRLVKGDRICLGDADNGKWLTVVRIAGIAPEKKDPVARKTKVQQALGEAGPWDDVECTARTIESIRQTLKLTRSTFESPHRTASARPSVAGTSPPRQVSSARTSSSAIASQPVRRRGSALVQAPDGQALSIPSRDRASKRSERREADPFDDPANKPSSYKPSPHSSSASAAAAVALLVVSGKEERSEVLRRRAERRAARRSSVEDAALAAATTQAAEAVDRRGRRKSVSVEGVLQDAVEGGRLSMNRTWEPSPAVQPECEAEVSGLANDLVKAGLRILAKTTPPPPAQAAAGGGRGGVAGSRTPSGEPAVVWPQGGARAEAAAAAAGGAGMGPTLAARGSRPSAAQVRKARQLELDLRMAARLPRMGSF